MTNFVVKNENSILLSGFEIIRAFIFGAILFIIRKRLGHVKVKPAV